MRERRRGAFAHRIFAAVLLLLLAACKPEATPFPVDLPTRTPAGTTAPTAGTPAPPGTIRYGIIGDERTAGADLAALRTSGQVEFISPPLNPADLGTRFDVIAGYGDLPGGSRSPVMTHAALLIRPLPPLDNPKMADILRQAIDPNAITSTLNIPGATAEPGQTVSASALRNELANGGWPDGFDLALADTGIPGAAALTSQLGSIGIMLHPQPVPAADVLAAGIPLALIGWHTPEEQAALAKAGTLVDLYQLPISYLAIDGLKITFTLDGWPLAAH
jgi:hypothetical protein